MGIYLTVLSHWIEKEENQFYLPLQPKDTCIVSCALLNFKGFLNYILSDRSWFYVQIRRSWAFGQKKKSAAKMSEAETSLPVIAVTAAVGAVVLLFTLLCSVFRKDKPTEEKGLYSTRLKISSQYQISSDAKEFKRLM